MPIAIQIALLSGETILQQFERAHELGITGIEVAATNLTEQVPEIAEAIVQTGIKVAAISMGQPAGYLSPELAEREAAINALRQALANAVDLEAPHVVFVPHYGPPRMPDLTPYRTPRDLETEMMVWLLRTVSDLAYALDVELNMLPVNHDTSYFMTRLEQAVYFRQKIKKHPHVKIAVNQFYMAQEEADWLAALRDNLAHIGYIQLAEQNGCLPGQGLLDYIALRETLANYDGWLTLTSEEPVMTQQIADSMAHLRECGF